MKTYPSIPHHKKCELGLPCIAFEKHDGSNLRFEFSSKRGWYKFGTRKRLFDHTDEVFGSAINIFLDKYAKDIEEVLRKNKNYRGIKNCVVFCEFEGEHSEFGQHRINEQHDLILFDIFIPNIGQVPPSSFIKDFGHLHIPRVIYHGNFNKQFIEYIQNNTIIPPLKEGVVAKGIKNKRKIWMAKVKTKDWLERLKIKCANDKDNKNLIFLLSEELI